MAESNADRNARMAREHAEYQATLAAIKAAQQEADRLAAQRTQDKRDKDAMGKGPKGR